jgi:hypothetical protein
MPPFARGCGSLAGFATSCVAPGAVSGSSSWATDTPLARPFTLYMWHVLHSCDAPFCRWHEMHHPS